MAIVVLTDIPSMTSEQYQTAVAALDAAGFTDFSGRLFHVAASNGDGFLTIDVWANEAACAEFNAAFTPILNAAGLTPDEPTVLNAEDTLVPALTA